MTNGIKNGKLLLCVTLSILIGCGVGNNSLDSQSPSANFAPTNFTTPTPQPFQYSQYNVVLDVNPSSRFVSGVENIKFTNNSDTPLIGIYINTYLNAFSQGCDYQPYFDALIPKIFPRGMSYGSINITNVSVNGNDVKFSHKNTILSFDLTNPLSPNGSIEITIGFNANIPEINHRTGANSRAMWFGSFLPTLAVYDSNGWQIDKYYAAGDPFYSKMANFHVVINTPLGYTVAGTGQKSSVTKEIGKSTRLDAKLTRDFAFAISDMYSEKILTTDSGVEITLYYYSQLDDASQLLKAAEDSLTYYSSVVGSYPYTTLDIVECELFTSGGMKYPQTIFIDSEDLKGRTAAEIIARQVGYQWFYNVIGVNGVKDAWIVEGLIALMHDVFFYGENTANVKIRAEYTALANSFSTADNLAITRNLDEYNNPMEYYNIVCMKSKMMLYSLKLKMGSRFDEFLSSLYARYSFKTLDAREFIRTAEQIYEDELDGFFDAWLNNYPMPDL